MHHLVQNSQTQMIVKVSFVFKPFSILSSVLIYFLIFTIKSLSFSGPVRARGAFIT